MIQIYEISEFSNKKLNDILGYVSQKPSIFKGTIKSNINFGNIEKSIKKNKLEDAIDVSMSSDFINELEDKSNSYVAPNGVALSYPINNVIPKFTLMPKVLNAFKSYEEHLIISSML